MSQGIDKDEPRADKNKHLVDSEEKECLYTHSLCWILIWRRRDNPIRRINKQMKSSSEERVLMKFTLS